ncbi:MAG: TlpA disulfide reductase family protein [Candidatus Margulisiibacteriota bacterium]|nr:TlpA disulfide reductase family protein [Candidatus Margulisiibacteriota bacterium]
MPDQMYRKALILTSVFLFLAVSVSAMGERPAAKASATAYADDFTLKDISGVSHTLSDCKGKMIFLNFWATWCPPCRAEMPSMQEVYEKMDKDKYVMLAVNIRERKGKVKSFAGENGYTFPILLDTDGRVASKYAVRGIPTTYLIDKKGKVVDKTVGSREWSYKGLKKLFK